MKKIRNISMLILGMAVLAFSISAMAMIGQEFALNATKDHPNAKGTAFINEGNISLQARGLKPDSVYTVWFVNKKPKKHEAGAGSAPYVFKTDANGYGQYSSTLGDSPFGKWEMIMVVLHPNGDPKDMKSMVGALSAKL